MKILIDATNIVGGGGVSHLTEMLNATNYELLKNNNISEIIVVGTDDTLIGINPSRYLNKIPLRQSSSSLIKRTWWKWSNFSNILKTINPDIIFNPGGSYYSKKHPYITMCRNMLVFDTTEANRFGLTFYRLRFVILKVLQSLSMKNANGVIFISQYASNYVKNITKIPLNNSIVIHHGISLKFRGSLKVQLPINEYSQNKPYKLLYVSMVNAYKHQDKVGKSIIYLKQKGYPVELTIVGAKARGFKKFKEVLNGNEDIIKYKENVPYKEIHNIYNEADMFIFASTCENMPNILIEAMASGLPIACSKKAPMPEFLRDGGDYFDPLDVISIANTLEKMIKDPEHRAALAQKSLLYSSDYSWDKCAQETFRYIAQLSPGTETKINT